MKTSRAMLAVGAALFAFVAMGAEDCSTETKTAAEQPFSPDESVEANPDGEYELNCAYELGDFGDSGDPSKGYRFVAGGTVTNTGNIGIRLRATYKWKLLGQSAKTIKKTYRVRRGQERDVNVTIPVTDGEIDSHQNADGDCSTKVTIVDTFGEPSG